MKKSVVTMLLGASLAFSANALDQAGGTAESAEGGVTAGYVATGVVAAGIAAAVISNNRGSADIVDPPPPVETCNDGDELVDGVCVGTTNTVTNTVTVSGTQTITVPITVPVTFTYAPTVE